MSTRIECPAYPPADFLLRDLIVLDRLPLGRKASVCEVFSVESGATAPAWLGSARSLPGLDMGASTIEASRHLEESPFQTRIGRSQPGEIVLTPAEPHWFAVSRIMSACNPCLVIVDPQLPQPGSTGRRGRAAATSDLKQ